MAINISYSKLFFRTVSIWSSLTKLFWSSFALVWLVMYWKDEMWFQIRRFLFVQSSSFIDDHWFIFTSFKVKWWLGQLIHCLTPKPAPFSLLNVDYLFLFFSASVNDLWCLKLQISGKRITRLYRLLIIGAIVLKSSDNTFIFSCGVFFSYSVHFPSWSPCLQQLELFKFLKTECWL